MLKSKDMTQKQLIETGVRMFQAACFESSSSRDSNGQTWWTGKTCEGGGAYLVHKMNQDMMLPHLVAEEVENRTYRNRARVLWAEFKNALNDAAMESFKGRI
jgi:hypothetical protein